jgi:hypothetical protein
MGCMKDSTVAWRCKMPLGTAAISTSTFVVNQLNPDLIFPWEDSSALLAECEPVLRIDRC